MNNNKEKKELATYTIKQLMHLCQHPENKHFAYIGLDDDDNSSTWGDLVIAGNTGLIVHELFEQRTMLPYELRLHMMMHILTEDTDLVIEAQKRIKQNGSKNN